jgi:hypothetical protein
MGERFKGEPDPFDVTVDASLTEERLGCSLLMATLENGMDAGGGEVEVCVTEAARTAYGLGACVAEFESWLNSTLRPEYRLDAALAMGRHGVFSIVATPKSGPHVLPPPSEAATDLAA